MVQLKYFGDSRDFFKYDLITFLLKKGKLRNYVFVPKLTYHREDGEGNIHPRNKNGDKSAELLDFIMASQKHGKSLKHWQKWLAPYVEGRYATKEPVDETYFSHETRVQYWNDFESLLKTPNALIFVDPDTGLETGKPAYLRRMGHEKYILNQELRKLISLLDSKSVLMIYQHLNRNSNLHLKSVKDKIKQIRAANDKVLASAYSESDLAFLFISKSRSIHRKIFSALEEYSKTSKHKHRSLI